MSVKVKIINLFFAIIFLLTAVQKVYSISWKQVKGTHFIIEYADGVESKFAKRVLNQAEIYYDKIATNLGYTRYDNFWTWDNRTKIIIYFDKKSFLKETAQPDWAVGFTVHDKRFFETRTIVTFQKDSGFLNGILPHEIGHLILRDFVGKDKEIPVWFDEGVAQLYESNKKKNAENVMHFMTSNGRYIHFKDLMSVTLNKNDTKENIAIFYSQSVSMVSFLVERYGDRRFIQLCKELRDGMTLGDALKKVYSMNFKSLDDLEEKWLDSFKGK